MSKLHTTPSEQDIASTLSHLKLSTKTPPSNPKLAAKPKSKPVADSWEDDASSGSDTETETPSLSSPTSSTLSPISTLNSSDLPNPPPPTPASPTPFGFPDSIPSFSGAAPRSRGSSGTASPARTGSTDKRPEKTTAVAARLIAGGLGIRAPKRTEEEREYDKAMREKERKRRNEEKEREKREKEQAEERKRSVWED